MAVAAAGAGAVNIKYNGGKYMELTDSNIRNLMKSGSKTRKISIYIPTQPKSTSQSINKDSTRFKNALQAIEAEITRENDGLAGVYGKLKRLAGDKLFWQSQSSGLAVFADSKGYQAVNLPYAVSDISIIDNQYFVSPLLAQQNMSSGYYLLDVNLQHPQLYIGDEHELKPVEDARLPGSMEDELGIERRKKSLHFRSGGSGGRAFFFGHTKVDERHSARNKQYLKLLAERADVYFRKQKSGIPVLLAGTTRRADDIRPLLKYANVLEGCLTMNPEDVKTHELHKASLETVAKQSKQARQSLAERYREANSENKLDGAAAVIDAAKRGVVDTLILPIIREFREPVPGNLLPLRLDIPQDSKDFEAAVRGTAAQSGAINAVEIDEFSGDPSMKALLRYAG